MAQMVFNERLSNQLEVVYHARDMVRRRELAREALAATEGERVLDIGCGPGFFVAELLAEVGPDGHVTGVDASPAMLALAARRCAGRAGAGFLAADVRSLPVAAAAFDAALCVQVLEYVPEATAALAGMHRVLRPGGRIVIWDVDWSTVSWHSADPDRMRRVLRTWDAHLVHPSLPRTLAPRLRAAGFEDVRAAGHAFATTRGSLETFGASLMPLIEQFVAGRDEISPDEAAAWSAEQRQLDADGEFYFTCTQFCFTATRPAA
jgi:arsenite methyltransferase